MLASGMGWDVRCPKILKDMFRPPRRGYWYKVDIKQAELIVKYLSTAYGVLPCRVQHFAPGGSVMTSGRRLNGAYWPSSKTIKMHGRNHVKTIFHEFYHYLDHATRGKYNSSDNRGGSTSYGWQFADLVWEKLRE